MKPDLKGVQMQRAHRWRWMWAVELVGGRGETDCLFGKDTRCGYARELVDLDYVGARGCAGIMIVRDGTN